ncbi:hypothetical protein CLOM_g16750 [Closterium sp. NIES-68]|nr:hypothetical protein CLOM_g16750 [Closterium sp. NIES-68]GJP71976.1 hypothetical protein CLOP_g2756 [Closterium sp. NIES-67]GJP73215.1 hypothetical protein CLOP_g3954 [Closterium sp. NIES-67]
MAHARPNLSAKFSLLLSKLYRLPWSQKRRVLAALAVAGVILTTILLLPLAFVTDSGARRDANIFAYPLQAPNRPPLRTQECSLLAQAGSERAIAAIERWERLARTSITGFPARDGCSVEYTSAADLSSATGAQDFKHSKCAIEWVTVSKGPASGGAAPGKCTENLHRLVDSCNMNDIPLSIFGLHPSTSPASSPLRPPPGAPEPSWINLLFKYLQVVPPDRIVAVSDSDNVVMLPSRHCKEEHLLSSFLSLQSPVVFAANDRCFSSPSTSSSSSSSRSSVSSFFYTPHLAEGTPNRFLNSGMFIGYAWALLRVLEVVVGSTQGSLVPTAAAAAAGLAGTDADVQRQLLLAYLAQENIFSSLPRLPTDFPSANEAGNSEGGADPAIGSGGADSAGREGGGAIAQDSTPPITFASTVLDSLFLPSSSDPSQSSSSLSSSPSASAASAVCSASVSSPAHNPSSSRPFISLDHHNSLFQVLGAPRAAAVAAGGGAGEGGVTAGGKEVEVQVDGEDVRVKAEGTGGEACAFQQEDWVGGGGEGVELGAVRLIKDAGIDRMRKERGYIA